MARAGPEIHSGEHGVLRGCRLSAPSKSSGALTPLLIVAALLLAGGAATYYLSQSHSQAAAEPAPVAALYGIATDAEGAAGGDEGSLGDFQKQLQQLKDTALRAPNSAF